MATQTANAEITTSLYTLYSSVRTVKVNWLWYPYIAEGKITLLQGDPGDGKSTMMMNLIGEITRGGVTPDGVPFGEPARVVYQCSEDGVADTIKPRLEECHANCENVAFINEEAHSGLTLDDDRLRETIIQFRPRLLVVDPIQAYLGHDSDLLVAGRARRLMRHLGEWASFYGCAVVLIGHQNKKEGSKGLYRGLGSIDVVAAARSVLQIERDEENPDVRIIHHIKSSLAPAGNDVPFMIDPQHGFHWLTKEKGVERITSIVPSKREQAVEMLKRLLTEQDMKAAEIKRILSENGVGEKAARSLKRTLGIQTYRKKRQWYWSLSQKG